MASPDPRPYHHGDLRRTLIDAAVAEIATSGPANLSLRGLARVAGVSHAAPAHHFGDKVGLFTAIAAEGFNLLSARTSEVVDAPDALMQAGIIYIRFAFEHRGYFEVMFRPDLYAPDDPDLLAARDRAFDVLFRAAREGAGLSSDADVSGLVAAAWSVVHGFATLSLTGNFDGQLPADFDQAIGAVATGIAGLGSIVARQFGSG
jgi:AcrR family transcriptional regulator